MSNKIVQSFKTDIEDVFVFVYRNSDWQEWSVHYHKKSDPRFREETIYFASDRQDALDHAAYLSQNAKKYLTKSGNTPFRVSYSASIFSPIS